MDFVILKKKKFGFELMFPKVALVCFSLYLFNPALQYL